MLDAAPDFCAALINAGTLSKRILKTHTFASGTRPSITSDNMMIRVSRGLAFHTRAKTRGIEESTPGASFNLSESDFGVLSFEVSDLRWVSAAPASNCGVSGICGSAGLSNFQKFGGSSRELEPYLTCIRRV